MSKIESGKTVNNVVNTSTRKKNPGFVNPNKGIPVGEGCTIQDVPRDVLVQHMRNTENMWKARFQQQYGGSHGGSQSF
jgi:hypothetical protein